MRYPSGLAVVALGLASGVGSVAPVGARADEITPCPVRFESPEVPDGVDQSPRLAEAQRLEPMLGTVLAYGSAHPETFAGYGLAWQSADDASVYIAFSGDVDTHHAELHAQVQNPDELIVCLAMHSDVESAAVKARVEQLVAGHLVHSLHEATDGAIEVVLDVADEALAAELVNTFGASVRVSLGWFSYPMPDPMPASVCDTRPEDAVTIPGLDVSIDPLAAALGSETLGQSHEVRLRNSGSERISLVGGKAVGWLIDFSTGETVGGFYGGIEDLGYPIDLAPGDEATIPLLVGVTSCDPALGYAVPTGQYQLVAAVPISEPQSGHLMSEPIAVDVETGS